MLRANDELLNRNRIHSFAALSCVDSRSGSHFLFQPIQASQFRLNRRFAVFFYFSGTEQGRSKRATIVDAHSPHERVQISTVANVWKYLKVVLEHFESSARESPDLRFKSPTPEWPFSS